MKRTKLIRFRDQRSYEVVPNKFVMGVLLEQDFFATHLEFTKIPAKYRWLTEEEFYNADITFHGTFGNVDKEV